MNSRDSSCGEQACQGIESHAVIRIIEGGYQNQSIRYVEVGIAGRQAASFKHHGRRHGEFHYAKRLIVQNFSIPFQDLEVLVGFT